MQTHLLNSNIKRTGFISILFLAVFSLLSSFTLHAADAKTGSWVDKKYDISGAWTIKQTDDQTIISFDQAFKTKKGPDLKIFLSKLSIKEVTGKSATNDSYLVGALKSNKGEQEYILPAGFDISDYSSLLIHCEAYSVLWGGGAL